MSSCRVDLSTLHSVPTGTLRQSYKAPQHNEAGFSQPQNSGCVPDKTDEKSRFECSFRNIWLVFPATPFGRVMQFACIPGCVLRGRDAPNKPEGKSNWIVEPFWSRVK